MNATMWTTIIWIWAGSLILAILIWRGDVLLHELLAQRRLRLEAAEKDAELARREQQHQLDLEFRTLSEKAELRKAELARKAADVYADAHVIESTTIDRVNEQRQVIAARAEGRAAATREEALKHGGDLELSEFAALMQGYRAYVDKHGPDAKTIAEWLGSIRFIGDKPIRY